MKLSRNTNIHNENIAEEIEMNVWKQFPLLSAKETSEKKNIHCTISCTEEMSKFILVRPNHKLYAK